MKNLLLLSLLLIMMFVNNVVSGQLECLGGYYICETNTIILEDLVDPEPGLVLVPNTDMEFQSYERFFFIPKEAGLLEFLLYPLYEKDDFDFQLDLAIQLESECIQWHTLANNFDGPDLSKAIQPCQLITGFKDIQSLPNCNNYTRSIEPSLILEKDRLYSLTVLNATSRSGFQLDFLNSPQLYPVIPDNDPGKLLTNGAENIKNFGDLCSIVSTSNSYNTLNIYPNPLTGRLNISSKWEKIESVNVIDEKGNSVIQQDIKDIEVTLNTSALPSGFYIVICTLESGITKIKKIVKI